MLLEPADIITNRAFKNITINFDTPRRTHDNLVFILTNNYDDYNEVFNGKLFKPAQLYNVFTPRYVKPYGFNKLIKFDQNEIYSDISKRTHGILSIGKIVNTGYANRNLVYNILPDLNETLKYYKDERNYSTPKLHTLLLDYIPAIINDKIKTIDYIKNYIVFPITKSYKGLLQLIARQVDTGDDRQYEPVVEFLRSIKLGKYNTDNYKDIERIFFYTPNKNTLISINPQDPELTKNINMLIMRIIAMSTGTLSSDDLADINNISIEDIKDIEKVEDIKAIAQDDKATAYINRKEDLKNAVLDNIGKKLKAKLTDYSAASRDEQAIINSIDKKVDAFLAKDENKNKNGSDLIQDIENDNEIVQNVVSYIQTKTAVKDNMAQLAKNIQVENKVISSLIDVYDETDKLIEPEKIKVDSKLKLDKKLTETSFNSFNRDYNKKQAYKDKIDVFTAFSNPENIMPLTVVDLSFTDSSDLFNAKETAFCKYKTNDGRLMSFKLDIPTIIDDCNLYLGGNRYIISKQLTRLPIVKTTSDRVEITTNFQKMTLEKSSGSISRRNAYLIKLIDSSDALKIRRGDNSLVNSKYVCDSEYFELSCKYVTIESLHYKMIFNIDEIIKLLNRLNMDTKRFTNKMTPFCVDDKNTVYFIEDSIVYKFDNNYNKIKVKDSLFEFVVENMLNLTNFKYPTVGHSYIYSKVKFLAVWYPVLVLVAMNIGLKDTLRRAKIKYQFSKTKLSKSFKYVEIPFADGYFYFEDTPSNSMLLSVLHSMNTAEYDFCDFDTSEPWADYCVEVCKQPIYVKRMTRINIEKMMDPITIDVLKAMKLPTNIYDLLLLGSSMLVSNDKTPAMDMSGFRIRGNEVIYDLVYKVLSDAYRKYQQAAMNGSKVGLVIKQNAVISLVMEQENFTPSSVLNPLKELEEAGKAQAKGYNGINLAEAYKNYEIRVYSDSMRGILSSNSTPFSGKVGTNRSLTYDPKITHIRGFMEPQRLDDLNETNLLSTTELLMFGSPTHNDSPRVAMEVTQSSAHMMATVTMNKQLVSTGANYTVHKLLGSNFIFRAKDNGYVETIDNETNIAVLKYNSGAYDAIDLAPTQAKNTASGFYTPSRLIMAVKDGEKFTKDQVIAYHSNFFAPAAGEVEYLGGTLCKMAIASNDACYEDSCVVSERLVNKCASNVTMKATYALDANAEIVSLVNIGDHVHVNDVLLEYADAYDDPSTVKFIQSLSAEDSNIISNRQITSKNDGHIADIEIFYNVPFEELSKSIQDAIKKVNSISEKRIKMLNDKGISATGIKIKNSNAIGKTKIDQKEFNGVIINFYIEHLDTLGHGDKITASVANKGTVSQLNTLDKSALSAYRHTDDETIDLIMSPSGIVSRKTMSLLVQLYFNKLLVELGRQINNIINDKPQLK